MGSASPDPGYLSSTRDARRSRVRLSARVPYGPGETTVNERPRIPLHRRGGSFVLSLAVLVSCPWLAGCASSSEPAPTPAPAPSLTQEQQDDQAFEALLSGFLDLPFEGESASDLQPFLTGDALQDEMREIAQYKDAQQTVAGKDTHYGFRVTSRGEGFMVAQACLDVSGTRIIDATGADVTPTRNSLVSLQLKAVDENGSWLISDLAIEDRARSVALSHARDDGRTGRACRGRRMRTARLRGCSLRWRRDRNRRCDNPRDDGSLEWS
jgi:hypothetical protein